MGSSVKQPSWLSKVCCVHSFFFVFFFFFLSFRPSLSLPFPLSASPGNVATDETTGRHKVCRAVEEVFKKCEIMSSVLCAWMGGMGAENKVLRSVVVEEKKEEKEEVVAVGLLKAPVGKQKLKSDEAKRREEHEGHRNNWTVESESMGEGGGLQFF